MTSHNPNTEQSLRLTELLGDYHIVKYENIDGYTKLAQSESDWYELSQAIQSKVDEMVRLAVWKEQERIYEFATRRQANGLYVPIEVGIVPWLEEQLSTNKSKDTQ